METTEKQQIGTSDAARLKGMTTELFSYYMRKGRGPAYDIIAGRKVFDAEVVKGWNPTPEQVGRPKSTTNGDDNGKI